ncbi:MAG: leucine-rich repeat domain-containing protein [Roseburia sp.]|nr:leucine-rich repeat domain-containing protein [Roseburia sp.]
MNFIFKKISLISFVIVFLLLMSCSSHQHTYGDYEYNEFMHFKECKICSEKEEYFYHTFFPWEIIVAPTEDSEGVRRQVCSACGYFKEEKISPIDHIHQYGQWEITKMPSMDSKGEMKRVCSLNENHIELEELPILNSIYYHHQIVIEANCESEGEETYSYSKDGQTLIITQSIMKTAHTFKKEWTSNEEGHWHDSSCIHKGLVNSYDEHSYFNGFCQVCGYKEPLEQHTHQYGQWELLKTPTKDTKGELKRTCLTNESHIEIFELPFLNLKDYTYVVTKESSCSQEGLAEYKIVKDEQEFIFDQKLDLSDHTYSTSWSSDAQYHWHAANCEHTNQRMDYSQHDFENGRCKICDYIGYTEGLIYELSEDMLSYSVIGLDSNEKNLVIPSTYQDLPITKIGYSAFKGCTFLESIRILSALEIADSSFENCIHLESVELPDTLQKIGNNAFASCSMLENILLPDEVEQIGDYVFKDCKNLKNIEFSLELNSVGNQIVQGCKSLIYTGFDNALYLGNQKNPYLLLIQANDTLITSCILHKDTKFICSSAFEECRSLDSITIPDNVISIGNNSFNCCASLKYVIFNTNIKSIGISAFAQCSQLKYIYYLGTKEDFKNIKIATTVNPIDGLVYYYKEQPSIKGEEWTFDENQHPVPFL